MRIFTGRFSNVKLDESIANIGIGWGVSGQTIPAVGLHLESYLKRIESDAGKFLQQLQGVAAKYRKEDVSSHLLYGAIGNELLGYVDKHECDLLALGSYLKTLIEGILEGSVGRKAIIHCPKSVLIAKDSYRDGKELSAVLATDQSHAANRWIEQFIAWAPRGLRRIHVVAVIPEKMLEAQKSAAGAMDVSQWIHEGLATENRRLIGVTFTTQKGARRKSYESVRNQARNSSSRV